MVFGYIARFAHHIDQPFHLINGLNARGFVDKILCFPLYFFESCGVDRVVRIAQNRLHHHGLHDLFPAVAQGADGAVVVKHGIFDVPEFFQHRRVAKLCFRIGQIHSLTRIFGQIGLINIVGVLADGQNFFAVGGAGNEQFLYSNGRRKIGKLSRLVRTDSRRKTKCNGADDRISRADRVELCSEL